MKKTVAAKIKISFKFVFFVAANIFVCLLDRENPDIDSGWLKKLSPESDPREVLSDTVQVGITKYQDTLGRTQRIPEKR